MLCGDGVRVAINQVFTDDDWQHSTAAILPVLKRLLPPVTGGNLLESIIKIQAEDFDFAEYYSQIRASGGEAVGAIAGFVGWSEITTLMQAMEAKSRRSHWNTIRV